MTITKNIFISHSGRDEQEIAGLKNLLEKQGINVRDSSLTSDDPNNAHNEQYIKSQILAPNIKWAGTMLVLIGPDTANKEWVNWEINYAVKLDKQIIGVFVRGAKDSDVPESLGLCADAVVGWNSDNLLKAINGEHIFVDSNGNPKAKDTGARGTC